MPVGDAISECARCDLRRSWLPGIVRDVHAGDRVRCARCDLRRSWLPEIVRDMHAADRVRYARCDLRRSWLPEIVRDMHAGDRVRCATAAHTFTIEKPSRSGCPRFCMT